MFSLHKQYFLDVNSFRAAMYAAFIFCAAFFIFIFPSLTGLQVIFGQSIDLQNYLTYENNANGVKIDYPADWVKVDQGLPTFGENITVAKFSAPEDQQLYVSLLIDKLSPNSKLEDYTRENIDAVSNTPSSIFSSNEIVEKDHTQLGIYPGYKLVLKSSLAQLGNAPTISMHTWTVMNNKAYAIIYSAPENEYPTYLPVAQKMISSFHITQSSSTNEALPTEGIINESNTTCNNLLQTLKTRLAQGEISIEEFDELKQKIEC